VIDCTVVANRGVQPITAPSSVAPGLGGMKISLDKATGLASGTDLDDGTVPFTSPQQQLEQENKAVDYLEKACERKHFGGCHILGKLYYSRAHSRAEPGVPAPPGTPAENLQKGLTMLEKSCKYSYGESCSYLGMHHLRKGRVM
jgi:TPR repeat protein